MIRPQSIRKAQMPVGPLLAHCEIHKNEEIKHLCENCNVLVCADCIVELHNGHKFLRVKDAATDKRKGVQQIVDKVKSKTIPEIREMIRKAEQTHKKHSENGTAMVDGINGRANEVISEINKIRKEMIQEADIHMSDDGKKLKDFKMKMEAVLSEAEGLVNSCPIDIKTATDSYIVKLGLNLQKQVTEIENKIRLFPKLKETIFVPGKMTNSSIRDLLGRCVDKDQQQGGQSTDVLQPRKMDHLVETKLEVDFNFLHESANEIVALITQNNKTAWIATLKGKNIKHVDQTGHVDKTLTFTTTISDIAVTNDGGLLVTPNGGSDEHQFQIKKVKPNGDIVTFVDLKPLLPHCICTSKTGHIYVGCIDGFNYDVTDKNTRSVIKLPSTGMGIVQQRYQFDVKGQGLFTLPKKLQENVNGDLWVRDRTAEHEGRIVVLHQDGKLKFIYTGVRDEKITENFNPGDITAAGNGNMLICDVNNHIVHVLHENGTLLSFLGSQHKMGLFEPVSLSLDRQENQLWIGTSESHVQVLRLK